MCSVKNVFLEISQNSQVNTCARDSFLIKLQALGLFYRTTPDDCIVKLKGMKNLPINIQSSIIFELSFSISDKLQISDKV